MSHNHNVLWRGGCQSINQLKFKSMNENSKKPIGKFEWGGNIGQEKGLLEYVALIDSLYIPCFDYADDDPRLHEAFIVERYSEEEAGNLKDIRVEPCLPGVTESMRIFADRYNKGLVAEHVSYESYRKHGLIQQLIKDLELDSDKFWMLLLFVYDYSYNLYMQGNGVGESPNEQLARFVGAVSGVVAGFDDSDGTSFSKPTVLKICVKGERDIIIDNPTAIHYIADSTSKMMESDGVDSIGVMARKRELGIQTMTKDSPFIAFFARMLLCFFDTCPRIVVKRRPGAKHSQKETDLVCQLIAFTRISTRKCWTLEKNDTLKAFLKQYKDFRSDAKNSVYPMFNM